MATTNIKINELPLKTTVTESTDLVIVQSQSDNTTNAMTVSDLLQNKIGKDYVSAVGRSGEWADILNKPDVVTTTTKELQYYPLSEYVNERFNDKADKDDLESLTNTVALKPFKTEVYLKGDATNTTLASYGITDAYTKSEVYSKDEVYDKVECDTQFALKAEINNKADKAVTLAGYGIGDAYTKTDCDTKFATNTALSTTNTNVANNSNSISALNQSVSLKANSADVYSKNDTYSKDETYSKSEVDGKVSGVFHYKGTKPTRLDLPLSGNEQGDVWNVLDTEHNYAWSSTSPTGTLSDWDDLGGSADLSNYYTKLESDDRFAPISHNHSISQIDGLDTEINSLKNTKANASDVYTKTAVDNLLADKVSQSQLTSELNNYYQKSAVDTELSKKADKATTISGYGITDAKIATGTSDKSKVITLGSNSIEVYNIDNTYTKTQVKSELAKKFEVNMDVTSMSGAVEGAVLKVVNESGVLKLKFVTE